MGGSGRGGHSVMVALQAFLGLGHPPTALRLPLVLLGVGALPVFGVGLYSLLRRRQQTTTLQLAVLAFGGYTAFLLMDTLVYAAIARVELGQLQPAHRDSVRASLEVWIVILDILKGFTRALATFLFSVNMIGYSRLGTALGWAGILIALVPLVQKLASFPTHQASSPGGSPACCGCLASRSSWRAHLPTARSLFSLHRPRSRSGGWAKVGRIR